MSTMKALLNTITETVENAQEHKQGYVIREADYQALRHYATINLGGEMKPKVLGKLTELRLTREQYNKLGEYANGRGGYQDLCSRLYEAARNREDGIITRVHARDMQRINDVISGEDLGGWQDLLATIMKGQQ